MWYLTFHQNLCFQHISLHTRASPSVCNNAVTHLSLMVNSSLFLAQIKYNRLIYNPSLTFQLCGVREVCRLSSTSIYHPITRTPEIERGSGAITVARRKIMQAAKKQTLKVLPSAQSILSKLA